MELLVEIQRVAWEACRCGVKRCARSGCVLIASGCGTQLETVMKLQRNGRVVQYLMWGEHEGSRSLVIVENTGEKIAKVWESGKDGGMGKTCWLECLPLPGSDFIFSGENHNFLPPSLSWRAQLVPSHLGSLRPLL